VKALCLLLCLAAAGAAHADPRADVQRAFSSILEAGGFRGHAQGNVFGPGLPALAGEVDVLFPDRMHVRTDEIEFIALSDRAWVSAFGFWTPTDRALLPVTAFDVAAMRRAIAAIRDVRVEGTSRTQQCPAHVYRFSTTGRLPAAGADGEMRAWLCDGTGRPARLEAVDTHSSEKLVFDFDWAHRPDVRAPQD
jgi:outer membrane lipoprotein-sorting protein